MLVSGFPWLKGEERALGYSSLTSNCLCRGHNSALSPVDAAAAQFFQAIKSCDLERTGPGKRYLFSGHDIERWMLKTLANMVASKNLMRDGNQIASAFHPRVDTAGMLQDVQLWPRTTGIYFTMSLNEEIHRDEHFWLEPLSIREPAEVCGMKVSVQGLGFTFLAVAPDVVDGTELAKANYRPKMIRFVHADVHNIIELSWDDGLVHTDIELTFKSTVGELLASGKPLPPSSIRRPEEIG